tara:strand:+ start:378 stop:830 length:453 start_codon:yes stop_codon:yes gene_type:complete
MIFAISGCAQNQVTNEEPNLTENKNLVISFWEAFSKGDAAEAMSHMHEDGSWWIQGNTDISGFYTKAEYAALIEGVGQNTENGIQVVLKEITAEENRVAVEATSHGLLNNGKIYNNTLHLQHVIKDNQLFSVREYLDTKHVQETFGTPEP